MTVTTQVLRDYLAKLESELPFGKKEKREILLEAEDHLIEDAARDWYETVFKPVIRLFGEFKILDEFPDRTAASLYLDIMLHKYYLSEKVGRDVGLSVAFESYSKRFKGKHRTMEKMMGLARSMKKLFEK